VHSPGRARLPPSRTSVYLATNPIADLDSVRGSEAGS
jgi:hypothetical protein